MGDVGRGVGMNWGQLVDDIKATNDRQEAIQLLYAQVKDYMVRFDLLKKED